MPLTLCFPGKTVLELEEGSYSNLGNVFLWGQRVGDENATKYNATKIGNGGISPPGANGNLWFTFNGTPNGSITAREAGDLSLDFSTGIVWQADSAGNMSWRENGSIRGPAGNGSGIGNITENTATTLKGILYGNATFVGNIPISAFDYVFSGGGFHTLTVYPGAQIAFDTTGLALGIDVFGEMVISAADSPNSAMYRFGPAQGFFGVNLIQSGASFVADNQTAVASPLVGGTGYNDTPLTLSFFDGAEWQSLARKTDSPPFAWKFRGSWNSGTEYQSGDIVFSPTALPYFWICLNGPSNVGTEPENDPTIWFTTEQAYQQWTQPFLVGGGPPLLGSAGVQIDTGAITPNSTLPADCNLTVAIGSHEERLINLEILYGLLNATLSQGDGVDFDSIFTVLEANGTVHLTCNDGVMTHVDYP